MNIYYTHTLYRIYDCSTNLKKLLKTKYRKMNKFKKCKREVMRKGEQNVTVCC